MVKPHPHRVRPDDFDLDLGADTPLAADMSNDKSEGEGERGKLPTRVSFNIPYTRDSSERESSDPDASTEDPKPDAPPAGIPRISSRVSFNIPYSDEEEEQPTTSPANGPGRSRSSSLASQQSRYQYQRRRSTVAELVVERFVLTRERRWSVAISSFTAAILALLIGFTIGFPSNAILDLTGEATELPPDYLLPTPLLSVFAALAPVGAIFGGPVSGWVADRWGRKCSMMLCGVPYLIGYLTLSYAHYTPTATAFKVVLLTGRFISGVGMGWASTVVSVYIAEISSVKLRGIFGTLTQIMLTSGIIVNYAVGAIDDFPYYYISLVAVGIVALFEILMIWLPETPRWLLSRGYGEDAENVLLWLRGRKIGVQRELDEMKKAITANKAKRTKVRKEFLKRSVFVPFIYVLTVFFFHQAGGINAVASFASSLFTEAGISNPRTTSIYAVGGASLIGNCASFITVDLIGRTSLLILSGTGTFVGSAMLGVHFFITRPSLCDSFNSTLVESVDIMEPCNTHFGPLAIVSLVLYRFAFAIGFGPIPWLLLSELLPLAVRGVASGFAMFTTWSVAAIVTGFYLEYAELVQPWFAMWTFSLINLASVLFVLIFIPETKGKSLEEMERKFERRTKVVETIL